MMRSKATAALMRLKEIDRKYNIKRNDSKRHQSNVSTESSIDISNKSNARKITAIEEKDISPGEKVSPRHKADSKNARFLARNDNVLDNETGLKKSPTGSSKISAKTAVSEEDINSVVEEESLLASEETLKTLSNLESNSKGSDFNFRAKHEVELSGSKVSVVKSNESSSVATVLTQSSGGPEIVSEVVRSVEVSFSRKSPRINDIWENINAFPVSNTNDYEKTINEIIKIGDNKSEVISELSHATDRNSSNISFAKRVQYESDTFEEASSSTVSSSLAEEYEKKFSNEDMGHSSARSGVKEIKITPHKQIESVQEKLADDSQSEEKEIIELIAPKNMQSTSECDIGLDEELSNYLKTMENVDDAQNVEPISLLKSPRQTTPTKKQAKSNKKYRKTFNENTQRRTESSVASDQEKLSRRKDNSPATMESVDQKNNDIAADGKSKIEHMEVEEEAVRHEMRDSDSETASSGKFLREIPKKSDVTNTLRQLHRDAIDAITRRRRIFSTRENLEKSEQCKNCGGTVKLSCCKLEALERIEAKESAAASLENMKKQSKGKRTKSRRMSKSSKVRRAENREKVKERQSRHDCRQMHRLRKQAAAFRLQQEREDIRNYLLELERTRLEFGPGEWAAPSRLAAFKPLEFPKIAAFQKPDSEDANSKAGDKTAELQERISTIRQWLKDQYILYRDYSSLARTVNAKYIPASLEDAKKTIRQLQKATIKAR